MNLIQLAEQYGEIQTFSKKSIIFSQGENDEYIYIVLEGVLKAYYLSENGKEHIKSFLFKDDSIASLQALNGNNCSFSLLSIKECRLLKLSYKKVIEIAANDIETANSIITMLMKFSMKKEQREYELLCLSAEQRYKSLLVRTPNIYEEVTQNDIAKYLGITPVALSRIKNLKKSPNIH